MTTEGMLAYLREKVAPLLRAVRVQGRMIETAAEQRESDRAAEVHGVPGERYMLVLSFACRVDGGREVGRVFVHVFSDRDQADEGPSHDLIFTHGSGWTARLTGPLPPQDPRTDDVLALISALWPPEIARQLLGGRSISIEDTVMDTKLEQLVSQLDGALGSFAA